MAKKLQNESPGEMDMAELVALKTQKPKKPMLEDFAGRMKAGYGELTSDRRPLNDPELYLDPDQVPREGYGATALKNLALAAMEASPDTSFELEGGIKIDPLMGSIGKFNKAKKIGNVLHAAPEFGSPFRYGKTTMEELSAANKTLPRGIPGPVGVARADLVDMPKFEGHSLKNYSDDELKELTNRVWEDKGTVMQDQRYALDPDNFHDFEKAIRTQGQMNAEQAALTKKPTVRKLYNEDLDGELYSEKRFDDSYGYTDRQKLIERLMAENSSLPGAPKLPKGMRPRKK